MDGRRVEVGDGEGHGKRGEEGEGRGGGEQMHRGVVDEAWRVVGIVRVVGPVVMVGVFGGMQAWGGDCDLESGKGGAEAGLAGDGSGVGAEREGCVVAYLRFFSPSVGSVDFLDTTCLYIRGQKVKRGLMKSY